jgi:hypothetical protein
MRKPTDLWHVGIVHAPVQALLHAQTPPPITWLPRQRSFAFLADPFALRHDSGALTVFVEAFDYRDKRGEIHYYHYAPDYRLVANGTALRAPVHLSYPFLIQHRGATYLLPEAHRTGKLTLYRSVRLPDEWQPVADLLPLPAIDASVIEHAGRWWMFFALPGPDGRALRDLHIAYADDLLGPWQLHAGNPVRTGLASSRMGGTPFMHEGALHLPMQDCSRTYGGGIQCLRVDALSPTEFSATPMATLTAQGFHPDFPDGIHTLASCGDMTMIDVKRDERSIRRIAIDWQRRFRRWRA